MISNLRRHPLRVAWRLLWLVAELVLALLGYLTRVSARDFPSVEAAREAWIQRCGRRLLKVFQVRIKLTGLPPHTGLLISNHLSYLDILVLAALAPPTFVSKDEVRNWPVFGWLARLAGTIFLDRTSRVGVKQVCAAIDRSFNTGKLVVLFPEGTSTDGTFVAPFRPSLLDPALRLKCPVTLAALRYSVEPGNPRKDVCYWGDMILLPHLIHLLGVRRITAEIEFFRAEDVVERKEAAQVWRQQILDTLERRNARKRAATFESDEVTAGDAH